MLNLLFLVCLSQRWTLTLAGDIMLNGVVPGPKPLAGVASIFRGSSDAMANLEIPITASKTRTSRKSDTELKSRSQFILRADPAHAESLANSGLTFVTQANNHSMDFGAKGILEESRMLDTLGIRHSGAGANVTEAENVALHSAPGRPSIGLMSVLAFATTGALRKTTPAQLKSPGIAVLNLGGALTKRSLAKLSRRIALAHAGCDILVVGIHWGVERKPIPNSYQVSLGRALIDCGADVVWGHHPHVLEGAELYRGKPILYSSGNLISALPGDTGLFKFTYSDKHYVSVQFLPARIRLGEVKLLEGRDAATETQRFQSLCKSLQKKFPNKDSIALF